MSAVLEFIVQTIFKLLLTIPGAFVCWLVTGRKVSFKQFWEDGNIQGAAFIGGIVLVAMILIVYFVF